MHAHTSCLIEDTVDQYHWDCKRVLRDYDGYAHDANDSYDGSGCLGEDSDYEDKIYEKAEPGMDNRAYILDYHDETIYDYLKGIGDDISGIQGFLQNVFGVKLLFLNVLTDASTHAYNYSRDEAYVPMAWLHTSTKWEMKSNLWNKGARRQEDTGTYHQSDLSRWYEDSEDRTNQYTNAASPIHEAEVNVSAKDAANLKRTINRVMLEPWLHEMQYREEENEDNDETQDEEGQQAVETNKKDRVVEEKPEWPRTVEFHVQTDEESNKHIFKGMMIDSGDGEQDY